MTRFKQLSVVLLLGLTALSGVIAAPRPQNTDTPTSSNANIDNSLESGTLNNIESNTATENVANNGNIDPADIIDNGGEDDGSSGGDDDEEELMEIEFVKHKSDSPAKKAQKEEEEYERQAAKAKELIKAGLVTSVLADSRKDLDSEETKYLTDDVDPDEESLRLARQLQEEEDNFAAAQLLAEEENYSQDDIFGKISDRLKPKAKVAQGLRITRESADTINAITMDEFQRMLARGSTYKEGTKPMELQRSEMSKHPFFSSNNELLDNLYRAPRGSGPNGQDPAKVWPNDKGMQSFYKNQNLKAMGNNDDLALNDDISPGLAEQMEKYQINDPSKAKKEIEESLLGYNKGGFGDNPQQYVQEEETKNQDDEGGDSDFSPIQQVPNQQSSSGGDSDDYFEEEKTMDPLGMKRSGKQNKSDSPGLTDKEIMAIISDYGTEDLIALIESENMQAYNDDGEDLPMAELWRRARIAMKTKLQG